MESGDIIVIIYGINIVVYCNESYIIFFEIIFSIVLNNLVRTYIDYLDRKKSDKSYDKFENALFKVDSYCIYLRGIVQELLEMINKLHPRYAPSYLTHFINDFTKEQITLLFEAISKINTSPDQT